MLVLQSEGPKFKSSHDHLLDLFLVKKVHVQPSSHMLFQNIPNWFASALLRFLLAVFTFKPPIRREVNRPTDWRILKIFLAQFRIQSEIFNGFVDLAMAADCSFIHFLDTDFGLCAFKKKFCLY